MPDVIKRRTCDKNAADQYIGRSLLAGCGERLPDAQKSRRTSEAQPGVAQVVVARIHAQARVYQRVVAECVSRGATAATADNPFAVGEDGLPVLQKEPPLLGSQTEAVASRGPSCEDINVFLAGCLDDLKAGGGGFFPFQQQLLHDSTASSGTLLREWEREDSHVSRTGRVGFQRSWRYPAASRSWGMEDWRGMVPLERPSQVSGITAVTAETLHPVARA